jgi:hypothetical protein
MDFRGRLNVTLLPNLGEGELSVGQGHIPAGTLFVLLDGKIFSFGQRTNHQIGFCRCRFFRSFVARMRAFDSELCCHPLKVKAEFLGRATANCRRISR